MVHQCTQNLTKSTIVSSQNWVPIFGAPIAKRSTDASAPWSMSPTDVPLQMWSTDVSLAKRALVHMGHGEPTCFSDFEAR